MTCLVGTLAAATLLLSALLLALVDATRQAAAISWTTREDLARAELARSGVGRRC